MPTWADRACSMCCMCQICHAAVMKRLLVTFCQISTSTPHSAKPQKELQTEPLAGNQATGCEASLQPGSACGHGNAACIQSYWYIRSCGHWLTADHKVARSGAPMDLNAALMLAQRLAPEHS